MASPTQVARKIMIECGGMRARQLSRVFSRIYDESLKSLDVQESQLSVLVGVAMFGEHGATMSALAGKLVMDRTTLTRNVVPLEKRGLLVVARSAGDARARVIHLTKAGERLLEAAGPLWEEAQKKIRKALGQERFEALRAQLDDAVTRVEAFESKR